jgi:hypothetical protein
MKKLVFYICFLSPFSLPAQKWSVDYSFGYGKFALEDVKQMQTDFKTSLADIGAESVELYPNRFPHSVSFGYIGKEHHAGVTFSYLTTAGRLNVIDYSGDYTVDFLLNAFRGGLFYRIYVFPKPEIFNFYLQIASGLIFSRLNVREDLNIGNDHVLNNYMRYKSAAAYIEPSVGITINIFDKLGITVGMGYEIDAGGKMQLAETNYESLPNVKTGKIQWTGMRLYAGLSLAIPSRLRF